MASSLDAEVYCTCMINGGRGTPLRPPVRRNEPTRWGALSLWGISPLKCGLAAAAKPLLLFVLLSQHPADNGQFHGTQQDSISYYCNSLLAFGSSPHKFGFTGAAGAAVGVVPSAAELEPDAQKERPGDGNTQQPARAGARLSPPAREAGPGRRRSPPSIAQGAAGEAGTIRRPSQPSTLREAEAVPRDSQPSSTPAAASGDAAASWSPRGALGTLSRLRLPHFSSAGFWAAIGAIKRRSHLAGQAGARDDVAGKDRKGHEKGLAAHVGINAEKREGNTRGARQGSSGTKAPAAHTATTAGKREGSTREGSRHSSGSIEEIDPSQHETRTPTGRELADVAGRDGRDGAAASVWRSDGRDMTPTSGVLPLSRKKISLSDVKYAKELDRRFSKLPPPLPESRVLPALRSFERVHGQLTLFFNGFSRAGSVIAYDLLDELRTVSEAKMMMDVEFLVLDRVMEYYRTPTHMRVVDTSVVHRILDLGNFLPWRFPYLVADIRKLALEYQPVLREFLGRYEPIIEALVLVKVPAVLKPLRPLLAHLFGIPKEKLVLASELKDLREHIPLKYIPQEFGNAAGIRVRDGPENRVSWQIMLDEIAEKLGEDAVSPRGKVLLREFRETRQKVAGAAAAAERVSELGGTDGKLLGTGIRAPRDRMPQQQPRAVKRRRRTDGEISERTEEDAQGGAEEILEEGDKEEEETWEKQSVTPLSPWGSAVQYPRTAGGIEEGDNSFSGERLGGVGLFEEESSEDDSEFA